MTRTYACSTVLYLDNHQIQHSIRNSDHLLSEYFYVQYARQSHHSSEKQKKNRASRNTARNRAEKAGKVRKGDGKDIDHKNGNPRDNKPSNLRVQSKSTNRSFPRNKKAGKR